MISFLGRDDGRVSGEWEMNSRIRYLNKTRGMCVKELDRTVPKQIARNVRKGIRQEFDRCCYINALNKRKKFIVHENA